MSTPRKRLPEGAVKKLFALSGNHCAFRDPESLAAACEERLAEPYWDSVKAIICHIRGWAPGSARYEEAMTDDERNAFENLILLCPNHATLIDDLERKRFPPEVLLEMKARSEEAAAPSDRWATEELLARYGQQLELVMTRFYAMGPLTRPATGATLTVNPGQPGQRLNGPSGATEPGFGLSTSDSASGPSGPSASDSARADDSA